ncbi:MAG: hypothetical protein IJB70_05595 [Clostridia bacterium]|nr:hypothetical protein [Clostridia bacterium]
MLNLSITPLKKDHIDEICEDIIEQQKSGATTHAMFMMKFNPECTPALDKATAQCELYDIYREKLDKAEAKHGVLVQATLGHITIPRELYAFMPSISLVTGEERVVTCCPLDPHFQEYIKGQMKTLAKRHPSIVMLDDDLGLLYKPTKGCACKYHMAEFNKRAGTNMSREEVYAHTQGTSEENKHYTDIYVETQKHGIVSAIKAMREGLDEVDPSIQGVVSGIYTTTFCEFSGDAAKAFAGKGNPSIIRLNGGPYAMDSSRTFTSAMFRAAILRENTKNDVDIFLAETDTCPQNRYSTSAALLHGHFTASILEGAEGAKHWITRLGVYEPNAGKAYRKILSKYEKFYEKMTEYSKEIKPFGCRIPLTLMQNYGFVPSTQGMFLSPWSTCFLERIGLPLYFSNEPGGAVFLDDFSADGFSNEEVTEFMKGTLILSAGAANKLCVKGYTDYIGVEVSDWGDIIAGGERIGDKIISTQYEKKFLTVCRDGVEVLSEVVRTNPETGVLELICPAVTRLKNDLGGEVLVFNGTPDMPYLYHSAFSLLNETRKNQFIKILSEKNHIPLYYPEDGEVYVRAGHLDNGEIMAAFFNIGLDQLEDTPFVCDKEVKKIEKLNPDGTRSECNFTVEDGIVRVDEVMNTLIPVVLFIS